ncbi:hypothetical protein B0J13DRAFT_256112 [Dactylonectria estremocensis]|uniref:Uncharacterized protein n=1 Tax=Dactylonectria estremocensis TaxID=1079267 RepID=A0A9P9F4P4_9HYPO|nr:hypothetical protein B0J13DRAFT_256112 [Dactylonectria estremocensis]
MASSLCRPPWNYNHWPGGEHGSYVREAWSLGMPLRSLRLLAAAFPGEWLRRWDLEWFRLLFSHPSLRVSEGPTSPARGRPAGDLGEIQLETAFQSLKNKGQVPHFHHVDIFCTAAPLARHVTDPWLHRHDSRFLSDSLIPEHPPRPLKPQHPPPPRTGAVPWRPLALPPARRAPADRPQVCPAFGGVAPQTLCSAGSPSPNSTG